MHIIESLLSNVNSLHADIFHFNVGVCIVLRQDKMFTIFV